jgi:hypothetical protein
MASFKTHYYDSTTKLNWSLEMKKIFAPEEKGKPVFPNVLIIDSEHVRSL